MANPNTEYFPKTGDLLIDATTNGYRWNLTSDRTVDFSVSNGFNGEYWNNITEVNKYMEYVINTFSFYANINFKNLGNFYNPSVAFNAGSEITLSLDGSGLLPSSTWAIGFFPDSNYNQTKYIGAPGDLFLNINSAANYLPSYEPGSQGWFLLLHELGHTLGLKHPHDNGGTGRPTFKELNMGSLDVDLATIMSYNDDGNWNYYSWDPATPMILDVYALQYLYGKNNDTKAGDNIYTITNDGYYKTYWDASGNDTIDLSSNKNGWTILLPNQSLSELVDTKAGFALPTNEYSLSVPKTLNWLAGDFENIIGTSYADNIYGNLFNNIIKGSGGNDFIDGGEGKDWSLYSDSYSKYSTAVAGRSITVSSVSDGYDILNNIELLNFSDRSVSIAELAGKQNADAVFRFYDTNTSSYFYSGSVGESDYLIRNTDNFVYEGIAFEQNRSGSPDTINVLRFLNTQTGTYFYTGDQKEAANVFQNYPHFKYEGIAYQAHDEHLAGTTELFRFLKTDSGTHLYTADPSEFQNIVNNYADTFKYEGIAYFVDIAA